MFSPSLSTNKPCVFSTLCGKLHSNIGATGSRLCHCVGFGHGPILTSAELMCPTLHMDTGPQTMGTGTKLLARKGTLRNGYKCKEIARGASKKSLKQELFLATSHSVNNPFRKSPPLRPGTRYPGGPFSRTKQGPALASRIKLGGGGE
jgi:hypothetical protein